MSAKAAMRRRRQAVVKRRVPTYKHRTSTAAAVGFAGKISKTARKSGGGS